MTNYDPSWALYWSDVPYEITFTYENGSVNIKGLMLDEEGFGLINNEAGGVYFRKDLKTMTEVVGHG